MINSPERRLVHSMVLRREPSYRIGTGRTKVQSGGRLKDARMEMVGAFEANNTLNSLLDLVEQGSAVQELAVDGSCRCDLPGSLHRPVDLPRGDPSTQDPASAIRHRRLRSPVGAAPQ